MDLYSLLQTNELSEIFKALPKLLIKKKIPKFKMPLFLTNLFCNLFFFFLT